MKMRLNKYLAECGVASRRNSENFILEGRVQINKAVVINLAATVDPEIDVVHLDGEEIKREKKVYFLLNKPKGIITTTMDEKKRTNVTELIKTDAKIFPVGRLDFNTTGALLLTNDGEFANFLLHPSNHLPRVYEATLDKELTMEDRLNLVKGIYLDNRKSKFEEITFVKRKNYKIVRVMTVEGRNHFVKRMFSAVGYNVNQLHRVSFAGISADEMPSGSYRKINKKEIETLFNQHKANKKR